MFFVMGCTCATLDPRSLQTRQKAVFATRFFKTLQSQSLKMCYGG